MPVLSKITLLLLLLTVQGVQPSYIREGDRVEQQLHVYRDRLDQFFTNLRVAVIEQRPDLLPELRDAPPQPAVYGYQMLPAFVEDLAAQPEPVRSFNYSWPITQTYIDNENIKLSAAELGLRSLAIYNDDKKSEA